MNMRVLHTVLSLGLNLVLERLKIDAKYRYLFIAVLVLNEIRGLAVVYGIVSL